LPRIFIIKQIHNIKKKKKEIVINLGRNSVIPVASISEAVE
jgi:hypothetical protein